ncbi:MAG: fructosamine kinase family protein [Bdellovibrionota bacterium]|nr:fructosamine kinase family protein [Bdellovibrionota bacterium]
MSVRSLFSRFLQDEIRSISPLSGGDTNESFKVSLSNGKSFFLKMNPSHKDCFFKEAKGLQKISVLEALRVPTIQYYDEDILILNYINQGEKKKGSSFGLGQGLASLHSIQGTHFGLEYDNYIGKNIQKNTPSVKFSTNSWAEFFYDYRIRFQCDLFRGSFHEELRDKVYVLEEKIKEIIDSDDPPSLLHGDLWRGNTFFDEKGIPYLIDPAIYFGNREAEFGMITLFGGFDSDFFEGYMSTYPLKKGWEKRVKVYQLYHLLNHLNLMGNSYYNSIISLLNTL